MNRRALIALCGTLAFGCANPARTIAEDRAALTRAVAERTDATFTGPIEPRDGALAPELLALLDAPLTEASATKIALLQNPRVRAMYEELGIESADLVQAGLLTNPVFDAKAKFFDAGTELELGLAFSFLDLFFVPIETRIAAAERDAARAEIARRLVALTFDVRRTLVEARAAQDAVALARRAYDTTESAHELSAMLQAAGNATSLQMAQDAMVMTSAQLDLDAAHADYAVAREPLAILLGLPASAPEWKLADPIATPSPPAPERVETRAVDASLDLAASRARTFALEEGATLASLYGWFGTGDVGPALKQDTDGAWGLGPALTFALPFFDQGQARTAAAAALVRREAALREQLDIEIRAAARAFVRRVEESAARLAYLDAEFVPARERFVEATLQNYNAMQVGAFDVLGAQRTLESARRDRLVAARDATLARLDLDELIAGSFHSERFAAAVAVRRNGGHR